MIDQNLANETRSYALITGASSGIGACFAKRLAKKHNLILVARDKARLEILANELREKGSLVEVLVADLTDADLLSSVEEKIAQHPNLEMLINNAGFGTVGAFASLPVEDEEKEVQLNIIALLRLTRAALPTMKEKGRGSIINVSSIAGFVPGPFSATYSSTKSFVSTFTESIAEELRGSGVYIQALCPGFTRTEFQERANVNISSIPDFMWMNVEDVVDESLATIESGKVFCITGIKNRILRRVSQLIPRSLLRRMMSRSTRNL